MQADYVRVHLIDNTSIEVPAQLTALDPTVAHDRSAWDLRFFPQVPFVFAIA